MFSYETASQYFKPHSIISALQYSYYHRSTGINVYGSDINTDVYCSNQNGENLLLKVIFVSKLGFK